MDISLDNSSSLTCINRLSQLHAFCHAGTNLHAPHCAIFIFQHAFVLELSLGRPILLDRPPHHRRGYTFWVSRKLHGRIHRGVRISSMVHWMTLLSASVQIQVQIICRTKCIFIIALSILVNCTTLPLSAMFYSYHWPSRWHAHEHPMNVAADLRGTFIKARYLQYTDSTYSVRIKSWLMKCSHPYLTRKPSTRIHFRHVWIGVLKRSIWDY